MVRLIPSGADCPASTARAIKIIAKESGLNPGLVEHIINAYHEKIHRCMKSEMPFRMRGIGLFFCKYQSNRSNMKCTSKEYFAKRVHRECGFKVSPELKAIVNGWVTDVGIKSNLPGELVRMKLRPDEIVKHRRKMVLDEQRKVGFNASLLFDEDQLPNHDKKAEEDLGRQPSVDEIMDIIGMNLLGD